MLVEPACCKRQNAAALAEMAFRATCGLRIAPEHVSAAEAAGLTLIGAAHCDPCLDISHNGTTH